MMSRPARYAERRRCALLLLSLACLPGCDRSGSESKPAPSSRETAAAPVEIEWVTREISEYRIQLRTPKDWTIEKSKTEKFYSVSAPRPERRGGLLRLAQVAVGLRPEVPATLEEASKDCGGASGKAGDRLLVGEQLPSGAYYILCEHQVLDQPHGTVTTILPVESGESVHCVGSGRGDLELEQSVCRSLSAL